MAEEAPKTTPPPAPTAAETIPDAPTAAETTPAAPTASETTPAEAEGEHQPADLMTSARTLAEAAQAAATQQTDKIDKAKVAEAAENVLEAAKSTGTLDDKGGIGQYLDKAQDYLHQMHSGDAGKEETDKDKENETETGGGSAAGGFMKMAQGFFK